MAYLDDIYAVLQVAPTGVPTYVRLSQNENGRRMYFAVVGGEIPTGCTATISGTKPDGVVYSASCSISGSTVTVNETIQLTAAAGEWDAKLKIMNGGNTIATGRIRFVIDADTVAPGSVPSDSELEGLVAEAAGYAEAAKDAAYYGSPLVASTVAGMTDKNRVYVYTGSESGYTSGNWYYWDGSAWTSGGVYNSQGIQTDTTLKVAGMAADAKATGDALAAVQVETDKTLTESDVPADAKVTGEEISQLKNDLNNTIDITDDFLDNLGIDIMPYPYRMTSQTINGITWTDNGDGTVTANGTATANSQFFLHGWTIAQGAIPVDNSKKYIVTGCPDGGSISSYYIGAKGYVDGVTPAGNTGITYRDFGAGAVIDGVVYISLICAIIKGQTVSDLTFRPQLRYVDASSSIKEDIEELKREIGGNIITYPYRMTSQTINGVAWVDNGDGTVTANGTAAEDSRFILHGWTVADGAIAVSDSKEYLLAGCPKNGSLNTYCIVARGYAENVTPGENAGNPYYDLGASVRIMNSVYVSLVLTIKQGYTAENLIFKPKMREVSDTEKEVDTLLREVEIQQSRSSYNMLMYPYLDTTKTLNGLTWTDNGDGTITVNGTASATTTFVIRGWSLNAVKQIVKLDENAEYTITGCPEGGSMSSYFVAARLYARGVSPQSNTGTIYRDFGNGVTVSGYMYASVYLAVIKGATVANLTFKPMLRYSALADDTYKEFDNRQTIPAILDLIAVSPDKYGAVGDGVADDTEAIQRCIDENPSKTIIFGKGTYRITDTIELYGASGGQYLLCGGATFVWDGETSKTAIMFKIEKDYSPTISSMCRIVGGNFNGANKCGIIFLAHAFYTEICSAKILNFTNYGILNGTLDFSDDKSTQAKFHDCHIFQRTGDFSLEDTCAIGISCPDNQISNIVTNRTGCAYRLWCGGNSFSNCHSTIEYPGGVSGYASVTDEQFQNAHIELVPKSSGMTQENLFANMYFNVGKYIVSVPTRATSMITTLANCHYTYYSSGKMSFRPSAYLCAGYPAVLVVNDFDVLVGDNIDFYDYCPNSAVSEKTVPRVLNIHQNDRHPEASVFVANNHQNVISKPCAISNESNPFPQSGKYYEIGAILVSYTPVASMASRFYGAVKIEYSYLDEYNEALVSFDNNGVPIIKYENNSITDHNNRFYIDKTRKTVTLNGVSYYYYSVYVLTGNNTEYRTTFKMYSLDYYTKCYVRSHVNSSMTAEDSINDPLEIGANDGVAMTLIRIGNQVIDATFVSKLAQLIEN